MALMLFSCENIYELAYLKYAYSRIPLCACGICWTCRRLFKFQLKLHIGLQDTVILNNTKNVEVILLFDSLM